MGDVVFSDDEYESAARSVGWEMFSPVPGEESTFVDATGQYWWCDGWEELCREFGIAPKEAKK
jgi:hypothetical protein